MPSGPPAQRLSRCIESIDHMIGFVDALRDSFENVANSYDQSLVSRLSLCDYLHCELESLAQHLGNIRPLVMRRKPYAEYDDDDSSTES
jgi:hypothetical protein